MLLRVPALPLRLSVLLLLVLGLLAVAPVQAAEPAPRTWVVDAVDDEAGNRWEAETGGNVITIRPGDTVEWRFERAGQEHDLTSEDTRSAWAEPVQEYRVPDGEPVRRTFATPGQYEYVCSLHGTVMWGTVIVEEPGANSAPTGTAEAAPTTGTTPLTVQFTSAVTDPDGDPLTYAWDFGTADPVAASPDAAHTYTEPGHYTASLEVGDGNGGTFRRSFPIHVGAPDQALPALDAHAHHGAGARPLPVAFSAAVTTDGAFTPFADGSTTYPDLAGTATMIRSRGQTYAAIEVTGLRPGASHLVHVHEQACGSANGGAHFRFDEDRPFAEENELWLPFTSDAEGRSTSIVATHPARAGSKAVSIVVHDPDNPALRIGCVDLAPGTADLSYRWDFGDGITGVGPDADHVYASSGSYTATVTMSRDGLQASATVGVVVPEAVGVVPADTTGPRIRGTRPSGTVRDRTPTIRAKIADDSAIRRRHVRLRVDGRRITGFRYAARTGRLTWTPHRALRPGRHKVRLVVVDPAGNRTVRVWRFRIRR
ncbi:PKD domain-containing protein [Nocardioides humi]|uniref:PKD domain-containing protein n=1 Tax=Nocardioides humi TaxID=449461 RepID=A0ABN2AAI4_9ACTN|nr:PKD domain-containing protein [Nocardioides humi]